MQWRRHFGAVGIMARISWVSASCVNSRFRGTGKTQVKPQQQFRGRSEMIPKSSIMFRFLLFQAQPACSNYFYFFLFPNLFHLLCLFSSENWEIKTVSVFLIRRRVAELFHWLKWTLFVISSFRDASTHSFYL